MDDRELLAEYASSGSQEAFAGLLRRYSSLVYGACLRELGEPHAAEDATQACFIVLARKAGSIPRGAVLAGWLLKTAANSAKHCRRAATRRARHEREAAMIMAEKGRAEKATGVWDEVAPHLNAALEALPVPQRDAIALRYLRGLTREEISRETGCGARTVEKRLRLGLEKLRARLKTLGVAVPLLALSAALSRNAAPAVPAGLEAAAGAACFGASAASPLALEIAGGVMKAMFWFKLKVAAAVISAVAILGAAGGQLAAGRSTAAEPPVVRRVAAASGSERPVPPPVARPGRRLPPALMVKPDKKKPSEPLGLTKLAVKTRIFGFLAETSMTVTFHNPYDRVLEGDLYFPLPADATVSGYALDIKGQLVDGVIVEKDKGRQVFEKIVRQGIDPGLVEWTKGRNFKTRVYPIPAKGTRTVMVRYVSELEFKGDDGSYRLPLGFAGKIKEVSVRVEVLQPVRQPVFDDSCEFEGLRFVKWEKGFLAEKKAEDLAAGGELAVRLPEAGKPRVLVETDPSGGAYFCVMDKPEIPKLASDVSVPGHITLLWDASGSRAGEHKAEFELLESYFARAELKRATVTVDLVLFRNVAKSVGTFKIAGGDASKLLARLKAVKYDGGTQLGAIAPPKGARPSSAYLLFTDGISNFGRSTPPEFAGPVYAFSAAAGSDAPALKRIAAQSGGQYFNLARTKTAVAAARIGREPWSFVSANSDAREVEKLHPRLGEPVAERFTLAGRLLTRDAVVVLKYGRGGRAEKTSKFTARMDKAVEGDLLRRYWAAKKLEELLIDPRKNRAEMVALGKSHGIVTPGTSLIVLDNVNQYVEHRIRPPKTMPAWVKQYDAAMTKLAAQQKKAEEGKLKHVLAMWSARDKWWGTDFDKEMKKNLDKLLAAMQKMAKDPKTFQAELLKRIPKIQEATGAVLIGGKLAVIDAARVVKQYDVADLLKPMPPGKKKNGDGGRPVDPTSLERPPSPPPSAAEPEEQGVLREATKVKKQKGGGRPQPSITLKPWDPKTPYIAALKAAGGGERLGVYMSQRAQFGGSPAFFLDCADFFFKKGEKQLGMQVLSNIAELELENAALLRILGHRLAQIGELDLSVLVFEEVKRMRPEEPQSWRDLALVLAQRADRAAGQAGQVASVVTSRDLRKAAAADYARSLKLLAHVVMNRWDRFAEIELIALMELNAIFARAKRVGLETAPVDERLVKLMPCDVRIILTWDADLTDMDLWVIEPTGEKAYYGHRRTTIGANFSRDFTRGYGPEEYYLKKAVRGKFKIQTNFYGSSAQKLTGAVTLQLEIFTDWGRPTQKSKTVTVRLTEKKETLTIGEIEF